MSNTKLPAQKYDPENITYQTTETEPSNFYITTKRKQYKWGNLKTLYPERNSNKCYAAEDPRYEPKDSWNQTSENYPDNIT